jgi:hypothetical protein
MIRTAFNESSIKLGSVKIRKLVTKLEEDFSIGRGESEADCFGPAREGAAGGYDDKRGIMHANSAGFGSLLS